MCNQKYHSVRIIFCMLWIVSSAMGQSRIMTLDECISMALKNNSELKIQRESIQESDARVKQVKSGRWPQFNAEATYLRFSDVMEIDLASRMSDLLPLQLPPTLLRFGDEDNYAVNVSVTQPIFTGFKLSNSIGAAEYLLRAEQSVAEAQVNQLIFQVKRTFYMLLTAGQMKQVALLSLQSMEAHLGDVRNMHQQGMLPKNEVLKAEIKKSEISRLISQSENRITLITKSLSNLIGLDLDTEIIPDAQLLDTPFSIDLSTAPDQALQNRPETAQLAHQAKALRHQLNSVKADYFPMISFIGHYEYGKPGLNKLENKWMDYWTLGIAAKWSLWDWGLKRSKVLQAEASLRRLDESEVELHRAIQLDIEQCTLKINEAEELTRILSQTKAQAEENFRLVSDQFSQGLVMNTEYLDAETQLTRTKIEELQAMTDYQIAVADYERAIGKLARDPMSSCDSFQGEGEMK